MTTPIEPKKPGRVYSGDSLRNQTGIFVRCTHEQKAAWNQAAKITGVGATKTARDALNANAAEVLSRKKKRNVTTL